MADDSLASILLSAGASSLVTGVLGYIIGIRRFRPRLRVRVLPDGPPMAATVNKSGEDYFNDAMLIIVELTNLSAHRGVSVTQIERRWKDRRRRPFCWLKVERSAAAGGVYRLRNNEKVEVEWPLELAANGTAIRRAQVDQEGETR